MLSYTYFQVAGTSYRQNDVGYVVDMVAETDHRAIRLVREPDNSYDNNVVKVEWNKIHIGYVPREKAAQIAPLLDAGWEPNYYIRSYGYAGTSNVIGVSVEAITEPSQVKLYWLRGFKEFCDVTEKVARKFCELSNVPCYYIKDGKAYMPNKWRG